MVLILLLVPSSGPLEIGWSYHASMPVYRLMAEQRAGEALQPSTPDRRSYTDEFKRNAVSMLLDGHSAASVSFWTL